MTAMAIGQERVTSSAYDEDVIRLFVIATVFWGVVGFLAGTFIAFPARLSGAQLRSALAELRSVCDRCTPRR